MILTVFTGNTKDDQTPKTIRDPFSRVFRIRAGVYLGNRGIENDKEATPDLESDGVRRILAVRNDEHEDMLRAAQGTSLVAVSLRNEVWEVILDRECFVMPLNEARRKKELATLERKGGPSSSRSGVAWARRITARP